MIIRDHAGVFIRGKTMRFAGKVAVAEAEAVGVLEAVSWIKEFPSQPVVIETDSLLTVDALRKKQNNYLELGTIFEQCWYQCCSRIDVSVRFVRKQTNKAAQGGPFVGT